MPNPLVSEASFALQMVEKYRALLLKCAGLSSVTIDGNVVMYRDLKAEYNAWSKKLARLNGTVSQVSGINLEHGIGTDARN